MLTFLLLSVVMIVGALGVITLKQPVHAALSLVGTLLTLAVTYVTLQAHFLAAIQVIVYAGAIMVLFLFVIMLLNIQGEEREENFAWMRPAAYAVGLLAAAGIAITAFKNPNQLPDAAVIAAALGGGSAAEVGEALFTDFVLAFQLVGVLLLTGVIGAVSLVQRKAEEAVKAQQQAAVAVTPSRSAGGVAVLERSDGPAASPQPSRAAPRVKTPQGATKASPKPERTLKSEKAMPSNTSKSLPTKSGVQKDVAKSSKPDDLKRIKGVGPKLEKLLHRNGVTTFEQLANLNPKEVEELDSKLESFQGRIERDNWLEQAKELAEEKQNG